MPYRARGKIPNIINNCQVIPFNGEAAKCCKDLGQVYLKVRLRPELT